VGLAGKGLVKALTVDVRQSTGRVLCSTIFRPGGKKLLAKGHQLSEEDVKLLETEGMREVWVTELEEGEVGEDQAVSRVGMEMGCGVLEIRLAAGGRANLTATEPCCNLIDEELLKQINCTSNIAIATLPNFSYAEPGRRVATVKSAPFAIAQAELEAVTNILTERGPILQARPIRKPTVAVLYTDPNQGDRARLMFESIMHQRLEPYPLGGVQSLAVVEREDAVVRGLESLLRTKPTVILIASTTAPAGPYDTIGRAICKAGCQIERFMAPVEPGNLLLLSYHGDTPIISAPGCFRSAKTNVVDLILPPALAQYRVSGWEIAALGHGGLLM
jgi:molybdenum cofactor cytidylyltransferase